MYINKTIPGFQLCPGIVGTRRKWFSGFFPVGWDTISVESSEKTSAVSHDRIICALLLIAKLYALNA